MSVYLLLSAIALIDVPVRQSYIISVIGSQERTKATGLKSISRNAARAVSPSLSGYAFEFLSLSVPFFISGIL